MKAAALLATVAAVASPAVVSGMTRVEIPSERVSDRQLEVSVGSRGGWQRLSSTLTPALGT